MKAVLRAIFSNLHIKLLAILVAAAVWVYVVNAGAQIGTLDAKIPVSVYNLDPDLALENEPGEIEITVRAEQNIFGSLKASDFTAFVDLEDVKSGEHEFEVRVVTDVPGVQIIEKIPNTVEVSLSLKTTVDRSVNVDFEGNVAEGFVTGEPKVAAEKVQVEGAKRVIERVTKVVATVKLSGEEAEIVQDVPLRAFDANNNEVQNVSISPSSLEVTVPVERQDDTKTVGIKTNIEGTPPAGFSVGTISADRQSVTLRGKSSDLEKVEFIETESVNVASATQGFTREVGLIAPEGIEIQDGDRVNVTVEISQVTKQRSLNAEVLFVGLNSSLKVSSASPSTVTVVVTGSESVINSIEDGDVKVEVDLQGRAAGTFNISIKTSNVSKPSNIQVQSLNPQSISVTLVSK